MNRSPITDHRSPKSITQSANAGPGCSSATPVPPVPHSLVARVEGLIRREFADRFFVPGDLFHYGAGVKRTDIERACDRLVDVRTLTFDPRRGFRLVTTTKGESPGAPGPPDH